MSYIEFRNVTKYYNQTRAVDSFNLSMDKGEMVALLGPSGCGKTTTLRMLAGFISVSEGQIALDGREITHVPAHQRNIGMVFQGYALFPHMTVAKNVAFGLEMQRLKKSDIDQRVQEALSRVRLGEFADRMPRQLSGGQQQRVALARAMAINPDVLLLDEPLSALDARLRHEVRAEIRQLQRELNLTTLIVTHDQDEALSMADRLVVMSKGCIEQIGTPAQLYETPANRFVAEFMGKTNLLEGSRVEADGFRTHSGIMLRTTQSGGRDAKCLSFRPERAHIVPADAAEDSSLNSLSATIRLFTYLGPVVECQLGLPDGQSIQVMLPNVSSTTYTTFAEGTPVKVRWSPDDSRLLS
ncbi:ABC transporter ATP-binding protein [Castellaniella sp. GW247-6E4]|uniref:ABC transporter ATP-binding protein n=1 Tax=Castellaniella sp. GW247-6E4 TaxID=3140380 RepID=UPI003314D1B1